MSVVIGTLHVDLTANTASFSSAMDKASHLSAKSAADVKKSLEKLALAGIGMVTAVVGATVGIVHHSHEAIIGLGNMAQAVGTNVEMLSTLQYAALRTNVPFEAITTSMGRLAKAAFAAQNGNAQLRDVFSLLGVDVQGSNGKLKDTGDLLSEVAPKFAAMADGAGKTAMAQLLFGRGGATIIPFLKDWASGQAELTENSKKFGMTLTSEVIEKAQKFDDTIDDLMAVSKGFGYQLTAAAYPALAKFGDKLVEIAVKADIPKLAAGFGQNLASALQMAGNALDFVVTHANALKLAFEGLIALRVANVVVPLIASFSGFGKLTEGVLKFSQSMLGIKDLVPVLLKMGSSLAYSVGFIRLLAVEEGIAAAASYVFGGALAFIAANPIVVAIGAIAALGAALYAYRDAAFEAYGATYTWGDAFRAAFFMEGFVGNEEGLKRAKARRLAATHKDQGPELDIRHDVRGKTGLELPDTKLHEKDIFGEEIKKLDLAIATQKAYLAVIGASPAKILEVESAQKAETKILELDVQMYEKYRRHLTEAEKATLRQKIATEESVTALVAYGKEVDGQVQSTQLAVLQTRNLAQAQLDGDEAVRQVTIDNAILGLTYNKTAEALETTAVAVGKLRDLMEQKSSAEFVENARKELRSLQQELEIRKILNQTIIQGINAQRQNAIVADTFKIDQQLEDPKLSAEKRQALINQKNAMNDLSDAKNEAADLERARGFLTPMQVWDQENEAIDNAVKALKKMQSGIIDEGQAAMIAAQRQELFNKATDDTIKLLLRFGTAKDGVKAFFLDMQKSAQSSASIIYEALHTAFDKLSDNLTELLTGGKADFGAMFRDVGKQMVKSSIKSGLQTVLGKLGEKFGISLSNDGSSAARALWVRMAGMAGLPLGTPAGSSIPGMNNSLGSILGSLGKGGGWLAGLFGALASAVPALLGKLGKHESVTSSISYRAGGGTISPDRAYVVGERGPELLFNASGEIASNSASQRMLGNQGNHYYTIDARGTDPVLTEQRTRQAIIAAHSSAISNSVQVSHERVMRTPQR